MDKFSCLKRTCTLFLICAATAIALPAQTFTILHSFDSTDGATPWAGLVQATDGNLYGTTVSGGAGREGTVFRITPSGTLTTPYSFCSQSGCTDGEGPVGGLAQLNGNLYGTTAGGGTNGQGTVFTISAGGTLTALYSFCSQSGCPDGNGPNTGLVHATDGNFYGITPVGGASNYCLFGCGTVFKITPGGLLTTLYSFCSQSGCTDGQPFNAGLVQAANGNFYGTTAIGGANGDGTVFEITPSGTLTTLHSFCSQDNCTDGQEPLAALVQGTDGNVYGTTAFGANGNLGGTIFKITLDGTLTTLYNLCSQSGCTDGEYPFGALIQATDGNFYGTTQLGGASAGVLCPQGCGTVFRVTPTGTLTTLYNFCSQSGCTDGKFPFAGLVEDTNGNLYGTTTGGGSSNACIGGCGTIFSLNVGLRPFVQIQPTIGRPGSLVRILGTNLTGATSVSFAGTPAAARVVSRSFITATVPAGATTGKIEVVTPLGVLQSNVPFIVRP